MPDEILLKIQADVKDLKAKIKQIESDFSGSSKKIQSDTAAMSSKFKAMGNILKTALSIAVLYKLKQGLESCIKATSDLEEVTAKFGTVFRGSVDKANKAVEDLVANYAMSTREAREHLSAVQDLLVPMGVARDEAADFSHEIVKLAADLGSFNNLPTQQVMWDIESALTGQYRTMRKYGVVLFDTDVKQRALNMGLARTEKELTAGDKALAAYRMMVEDSADAMGDMARTSDSYANSTKRLRARIEDLKVSIGEELMPTLGELVGLISDELIPKVNVAISRFNRFATILGAGLGIASVETKIADLGVEQQRLDKQFKKGEISAKDYAKATWYIKLQIDALEGSLIKSGQELIGHTDKIDEETDAAKRLNDELKKLLEKLKKMESQREEIKPIFDMDETYLSPETKKQIEWMDKNYPDFFNITPYTEEGLEKQREHAKLMKDLGKDMDDINQSFEEGIKYVWDWGNAIDAVFNRAEDKGKRLQNLFWSILGGGIGFVFGGPTGAGIGARIGAGVGGLTSSSTSTNRRSAELASQAVNARSYTAYKIGAS